MALPKLPAGILEDGVYKLPRLFSFIRLYWQVLFDNGSLIFKIEGHKILTVNTNLVTSDGLFYPFWGVRVRWAIVVTADNIILDIEEHRVLTFDLKKVGE